MSKFLRQPIRGMVTAVSVGPSTELEVSGNKKIDAVVKFKLESASIEDPQMSEFYPEIITTIRSISPSPIEEVKFKGTFRHMKLSMLPSDCEKDNLFPDLLPSESLFAKVSIEKITVKMKETDIPVYIFEMKFPLGYGNPQDLMNSFKKPVNFELDEMEIETTDLAKDAAKTLLDVCDEHNVDITLSTGDKKASYKSKRKQLEED